MLCPFLEFSYLSSIIQSMSFCLGLPLPLFPSISLCREFPLRMCSIQFFCLVLIGGWREMGGMLLKKPLSPNWPPHHLHVVPLVEAECVVDDRVFTDISEPHMSTFPELMTVTNIFNYSLLFLYESFFS